MNNDDDDFLSDLTDDFEEDVKPSSSKKTRGGGKADGGGYRIRGALSAPRATTYNAQHIYDQLEAGDISLDAEYQRDVVWPTAKQIGLIDSIFRNYYIPPVIFAVTYESDGSEKRICIDGKQRLTSIHKFMNGLIPHKDAYTGDKYYYKENSSRSERGKLLPMNYKKIFGSKQIVCMEYVNITPENEREIFQRVQLGMALTPAEKLQAVSSPSSTFIRNLLALYVHNQLGKKNNKKKSEFLEWDTSRGGDFRGVASAVYCIDKNATAVPSIAALTKWLQDPEELDETLCEGIHTTFRIFVTLTKLKEYRSCFELKDKKKKLKVSPAEFIMITVLIYRFKGKLTMRQLSEAIEKMRRDIRTVEQDIRMNSRVFKHMLGFIQKLKPASLKGDAKHDVAAVAVKTLYTEQDADDDDDAGDSEDEVEDEIDELEEETATGKGRAGATPSKRKRAKDEDDDDGDYKPTKRNSMGGASSSAQRRAAPAVDMGGRTPSPPASSISAPPPYSTQATASQRDRLDAIRRVKTAYDAPAAPPAHPDERPYVLPPPQPQQATAAPNIWNDLRLYPPAQTDLGRSIMERLASGLGPGALLQGLQQGMQNADSRYAASASAAPPSGGYPAGDNGFQQRFPERRY